MADKITIGLDDQTQAGAESVEQNLKGVAGAADDVQGELAGVERQFDRAGKEAKQFGDQTAKASKQGVSGLDSLGIKIISVGQALQLMKKATQAVSGAIDALADNGSPAFVRLKGSMEEFHQALLAVADDPRFQDWVDGVAGRIQSNLIPALDAVPGVISGWSVFQTTLAGIGEQLGIVEQGTMAAGLAASIASERQLQASKDAVAAQRERLNVDEKVEALQAKVAADAELQRVAQIQDEQTLATLRDEEIEAMRSAERAGKATAQTRQDALRRIELLERRLIELPKQRADAEIKAQEEASKARADAAAEFASNLAAMAEQAATAEREKLEQAMQQATATAERLLKLVQEAKGTSGQNLLEQARGSIGPQQIRAELQRQAAEQARQRVIDEQRASGRADQNLMGIGGTPAERAAATRRLEREREIAAQQASRGAAMQFNRGGFDQQDIANAQTSLIQSAASQAETRGQLDTATADALRQAANNQQQLAQEQQQQAQTIRQIQQALGQVGSTMSSQRSRAIAGGLRR